MKILIVGSYPIDITLIKNGVEAVMVYLMEGLCQLDNLDIYTLSFRKDINKIKIKINNNIKFYYFKSMPRFGNITMNICDKFNTIKLIKQIKPDLVHVHNHINYPFIITTPICPIITTIHGIVYREDSYRKESLDWIRKYFRIYLEKIVLSKCKHVIAVTPYVKKMVSPLTKAKIYVIENPVCENYFQIKDNERCNTIFFAGAIINRKNILGLLKIINIVKEKIPLIELRIAGDIEELSYFQTLNKYIAENKLEKNIIFLGRLNEDKIIEEYEQCSLVITCSFEETSGMIIQQAMAAGKVSIVSKIEAFSYIINDTVNGFLINIDDLNNFADKINMLLSNKKLREKMGENARQEAIKRFRSYTAANKTCVIYREILNDYSLEKILPETM
jgi:L-malate glycosyltransferase